MKVLMILLCGHIMFKSVVGIVRQLYNRDTRRQFCPSNHWINPRITLPLDRPQDISFRGLRVFTRDELEENGLPLTTKGVRLATVLRELLHHLLQSESLGLSEPDPEGQVGAPGGQGQLHAGSTH
jgi:hypothetical protein